MEVVQKARRRRRARYGSTVAVHGVLLWLVNVSPGWQSWDFLSAQFAEVVPVLNAFLVCGLGFNLAYLRSEGRLLHGLGDAASATLALMGMARLFVVFPFAVPSQRWDVPLRVALGLAMVGAFVGVVAGLGSVARTLHERSHLLRRPGSTSAD